MVMQAARAISNGLDGAAVGLIHHTGKEAARQKINDQYAARGGSAFADNARAILAMHRVDDLKKAALGTVSSIDVGDQRVFELTVAKFSYGKPVLEQLLVRRSSSNPFKLDLLRGPTRPRTEEERERRDLADAEAKQERELEAVYERIVKKSEAGEHVSKSTLRDAETILLDGAKISNKRVGALVDILLGDRRVEEYEQPRSGPGRPASGLRPKIPRD
jgi:RecA-family ATPase